MSGEKSRDYVIEFRTLVAESGWNPTVLTAAFHQGLSEELKDELVHRDTPASLDDLIDLVLCIDNRVRQRRRTQGPEIRRGSHGAPYTLSPVYADDEQGESRSQPMQLGYTHLFKSERDARIREQRCLYCRSAGHFCPACTELQGKDKHPSGEGGPLTDSTSPPRAQGLFLSTTMVWGMSETHLQAFVDSGAAGNFLDAGLANWSHWTNPYPLPPLMAGPLSQALFVKNFSTVAAPLIVLTRKVLGKFCWSTEAQQAELKRHLIKAPILQLPDAELLFVIEVDASEVVIGAVLSQRSREDKKLHPCAYFSQCLSPAEWNYDVGDRELLALAGGGKTPLPGLDEP
ncbi:hypothetical protein P4O66_010647 [Electrophorus voltai]|uniref:Reverse transcriptase/retrotransposon-derived protein RNase H-like domain-containing protein n=1 Tax=Electrophorus voltai TaxID=2609070 RepID=A0AAD9DW86_9TELE|nr:hypothetical protein P4O66_010647 [Electrophorus voltai]